ncbi:hypothetical protein ZWY2020_053237 [Hordeum vulgare]|nr:hypothetical protein ZWY2020_053237 [Hordeum vulgare]
MCTADGDMDGEWILTSELSFGSKKVMKGAQEIECEIKQDGMPEYGCKLRPVIRICNEGFNSGRRYMSCPYEIDDAWHGRSRMVIQNLADDNKKLQIALFQKEQRIHRMKNERNKLDDQRKSGKRKNIFLVVVVASVVTCVAFALLNTVIVLS